MTGGQLDAGLVEDVLKGAVVRGQPIDLNAKAHVLLFLGFSGEAFHCMHLSVIFRVCTPSTYKLAQHLLLLSERHILVLVVITMSSDCRPLSANLALIHLNGSPKGNSQNACIFCRACFAFWLCL